jgi:hypothetical protein
MEWEDLLIKTGGNISAKSIACPRKDEYNEPSVSLYKDGSVWVSGAKGCVRMFNHCPYELMLEIFIQRFDEFESGCFQNGNTHEEQR